MGLPSLAIKRPVTFSMIFLSALIIGIVSLTRLPVELLPNFSLGYISIFIDIRGGMPPTEVEKRVAKIVEDSVGGTTHLKNVLSISEEGRCTVQMQFEAGIDMDLARLEVSERFSRVKKKLPEEIERPTIQKFEESQSPIYIIAMTGTGYTVEALRKMVDDEFKEQFQRVQGVAKVDVGGGRERKILVEVDQTRLQAYHIPINQVINRIYFTNLNLLLGDIIRQKYKYIIRSMGEVKTVDEIKQIGVAVTPSGSVIRVADVATVKDSFLEATSLARVNILPVVNLYILKESAGNTVKVCSGVNTTLDTIKKNIDPKIRMISTKNQAEMILDAIRTVNNSLILGGILAVLILIVFLRRAKPVFIIAVSIPISVISTFIFMFFGNISLNVMTLSGLAIGLGMLVDSSIVVLENIHTKEIKGFNSIKSAVLGSEEMVLAIVASTITTIIVFLPIVFTTTEMRILYGGLAMTVTFSLLASLAVAVFLVPMLSARLDFWFMKLFSMWVNKRKNLFLFLLGAISIGIVGFAIMSFIRGIPIPFVVKLFLGFGFVASVIFIFLKNFRFIYKYSFLFLIPSISLWIGVLYISNNEIPMPLLYQHLQFFLYIAGVVFSLVFIVMALFRYTFIGDIFNLRFYRKISFKSVQYRWRLAIIMLIVLAVVFVIAKTKLEKEFIGSAEQEDFTIFVELPTGAKLAVSDEVVKKVEAVLKNVAEIHTFNSRIEAWSNKIYVKLVPPAQRRKSTKEVIAAIRPQVEKIQPAFIYFEEPQEVETNEVIIDIYGYDYDVLIELADALAARMNGVPGLTDVKIRHRPGRPEYRVKMDKDRVASYGLTVDEVSNIIHAQMRGLRATYYHAESKEIEVIVRLDKKFRKNVEDLKRLTIITPDGKEILLGQVADIEQDLGPSKIWRRNKNRMIQVSSNRGVLPFGKAVRLIEYALKDVQFPEDYFYRFGDAYERMIDNNRQLMFALIMVIFLIYLLLASLFESFLQPFIIMTTVVMAFIGVVPTLWLIKQPVNIGVMMGAMMLGGIVVNNAIVMVDHINHLMKTTPLSKIRILLRCSKDRLRPIMMTSLTTILALVPMAFDRSPQAVFWRPLAVTVISGLSCSTVLVLILLPGQYLVLENVIAFFKRKFSLKKKQV